jgi:hypothetical protein
VMKGFTAFLTVTASATPAGDRDRIALHLHLINFAAPSAATTHGDVHDWQQISHPRRSFRAVSRRGLSGDPPKLARYENRADLRQNRQSCTLSGQRT